MKQREFFSIAGLAVAAHTPETKKIWHSWENNKSSNARQAILNYAKDLGFDCGECKGEVSEKAFNYLLDQFPEVSGIKSFILRTAIISYS